MDYPPPIQLQEIQTNHDHTEGEHDQTQTANYSQTMTGQPNPGYPNPRDDVPSWWSVLFKGRYYWRWFSRPSLYFRPGLEYTPRPVNIIDGLGREHKFDKPFDCFIDPFTGKIETLYVQAPYSLCLASAARPNATWKRTPIRDVSPLALRVANLPFRFIPPERREDRTKYTNKDWLTVVAMWIPTVAIFMFLLFTVDASAPASKDSTKYLPVPYWGLPYPRLARNFRENREEVRRELIDYISWNTNTALSIYRTFRPRYLNYLVDTGREGPRRYGYDCSPVRPGDMTPFVVISFSSVHYDNSASRDRELLLAIATKVAADYFNLTNHDLKANPRAFWISANCMPSDVWTEPDGTTRPVRDDTEREFLASKDTYSISDIIRAAEHVIVLAGNPRRPWDDEALLVWGERVWTLPEIILSKGDRVTIWHFGFKEGEQRSEPVKREVPKTQFASLAWRDSLKSRQLIEHFTNLHLSRLELAKVALECIMSRQLRELHRGDRVYALMGLLRIRPPINRTDSSFQAFARLSLPQDSDRLMERLICLLPNRPDEDWELMSDQYQASLWDIYPETQVCGIGENDTVIVDNAWGAQIQWDRFTKVRSLRKITVKRVAFYFIIKNSPILFWMGVIFVATSPPSLRTSTNPVYNAGATYNAGVAYYKAGVALITITLVLFLLPAPYILWKFYSGKLREIEPCFFGIEGYVPLEVIEERLFGTLGGRNGGRLRWSAYGSPLSRHMEGEKRLEPDKQFVRTQQRQPEQPYPDPTSTVPPGFVSTYPVKAIDPTSPCVACETPTGAARYCDYHPTVAWCQDRTFGGRPGDLKVFTLVDTLNLTVTLFLAARPPTVLVVAGSEGGMKRAIACSVDVTTGTLYRETVLRLPSQCVERMERLPRVRLGLHWPVVEGDFRPVTFDPPAHPAYGHRPAEANGFGN